MSTGPNREAERPIVRRIVTTEDIDKITEWMFDWWGKAEGYSIEAVHACMEHSLQTVRLPQTYGLYLGNELIGIYQFTYSDLFPRPDIYPWLANVYIEKAHRGKGFGTILLDSVRKNAEECGLSELFLFTEHEGLYERFGWEFVGNIDTFLEPRLQRLYRMSIDRQIGTANIALARFSSSWYNFVSKKT